jgi:hypothetical protein
MTEFMFVRRFRSHQTESSSSSKSVCYFLEQVLIPSTFFPPTGMIRHSTTSICTALSCINTRAVRLHLGPGADDKKDPSRVDGSSMALRSTIRTNCIRSRWECTYDITYDEQKRWKGKTENPFASPVKTRNDLPRRGSYENWFIFMRLVEIIKKLPSLWTYLPPVTSLLT